jgi:uncharacterized protein (DUF3084 family)
LGNAGTFLTYISGLLALVSVSAGVFTALRSTKDRRDRDAERDRIGAERNKLNAEGDKIKNEAAEIALRALRTELDAAYKDIERRRIIMDGQDERITAQDGTIRRQTAQIASLEDAAAEQSRRVDRLEKWVRDYKTQFEKIGIKVYVDTPIAEWPDNREPPGGQEAPDPDAP